MSDLVAFEKRCPAIKTRHSFYETTSSNGSAPSDSDTYSRSHVDIVRTKDFPSIIDSGCVNRHGLLGKRNSADYYKKYEHDEVPAKDGSTTKLYSDNAATGDRKELTNSDLDKMETRIYRNISKELQTDESYTSSQESNVKLFKTTVQGIFDSFNSNMGDIELLKNKFYDILSKSKENSVKEMEDFIKEMIQHITSSESRKSSGSNETNLMTYSEVGTEVSNEIDSITFSHDTGNYQSEATKSTVEAYKNINYLTDSTFDKESSLMNRSKNTDKSYNIYLSTRNPCAEIKIDRRNLLSEINIRNSYFKDTYPFASAENFQSIAAKKLQLKKCMIHQEDCQSNHRDIPLQISYAKNNIHTKDDPEDSEEKTSFLYKICNYLCKKLRKTSFG